MSNIHKNLKFAFIVARNATLQINFVNQIEQILAKFNITALYDKETAKNIAKTGLSHDEIFAKTKLIISIGGDGNFIAVCRKYAQNEAFVFGVHTGHLGFLTDVTIDKFEHYFSEFLDGNYEIQKPNLLEARFIKGSQITIKQAFNDIVFMRKKIKSITQIEAFLDKKHFNSYIGDGVIISSAMGSTAYNMSAGGAIIYPKCEVFSLTPVCSHSLTQRPLILPSKFKVEFISNDDVSVIIDGQESLDMKNYDKIEVGVSKFSTNIIYHKDRDYFGVLKQKLRWGHE